MKYDEIFICNNYFSRFNNFIHELYKRDIRRKRY